MCVIFQLTRPHNKKETITDQSGRICRLHLKHSPVQEAKFLHYYAVSALFPGMLVQCLDDTCDMCVCVFSIGATSEVLSHESKQPGGGVVLEMSAKCHTLTMYQPLQCLLNSVSISLVYQSPWIASASMC